MILDYILGKNTNGLDILQKACQIDHEVRIIMISGYQSLADPSRLGQGGTGGELGASHSKPCKALGKRMASGFLSKPFLIQELLNAVGKKSRHRGVKDDRA